MKYHSEYIARPQVQKKSNLTVGEPNDQYEKEADQVAEQVMRMPNNAGFIQPKKDIKTQINRKCANCEEEGQLQRKGNGNAPEVQPDFENKLHSSKGQGTPLSNSNKAFFESRMGADFGNVKIHTGNQAAQMSRSISAKAFTHGNDVYFNQTQYNPESNGGKKLLAHELTHVVQQTGNQIRRSSNISPSTSVAKEDNESAVGAPSIQKMEHINQSTPSNHDPKLRQPRPWPTEGYNYFPHTDAGTQVKGFVSLGGKSDTEKYWCHGHSLGTFYHSLYSVYSGKGMRTAITDEYKNVSSADLRSGDLAVWTPNFDHSAKFKSIVRDSSGSLDEGASTLSTKNGSNPLKDDSLTGIKDTYKKISPGSVVQFYRHK